MTRVDPFRGFRFLVEIDGITSAGFARLKGLSREVKFESYREGGMNEYEHKLAGQVAFPALVLERGLAADDLWNWAQSTADGEVTRRNLRITFNDESGKPAWGWLVSSALPVKWTLSDLDGSSPNVAIESLELVHHGIRKAA
jgi:phage tail-like protein